MKNKIEWLKKRLKSTTIWLNVIAPSVVSFMTLHSNELRALMNEHYVTVLVIFSAIAYINREKTNKSLNDK